MKVIKHISQVCSPPPKPDKPDEEKPEPCDGPDCEDDYEEEAFKPEKPDEGKPEKLKYGCCQCAPGWMDLNGDPRDGCETKLAACDGETRCSEFADCFELGTLNLI